MSRGYAAPNLPSTGGRLPSRDDRMKQFRALSQSFADFLTGMTEAHKLLEVWFGSEQSGRCILEAASDFAGETGSRILCRHRSRG